MHELITTGCAMVCSVPWRIPTTWWWKQAQVDGPTKQGIEGNQQIHHHGPSNQPTKPANEGTTKTWRKSTKPPTTTQPPTVGAQLIPTIHNSLSFASCRCMVHCRTGLSMARSKISCRSGTEQLVILRSSYSHGMSLLIEIEMDILGRVVVINNSYTIARICANGRR